jgi:hypothetical protein
LRPEKSARRIRSNAVAVQAGATKVLQTLLEPLAGFAFDCGLNANAVSLLLRVAVVRSAARRQHENGQPKNISGIAAMTGVSRGEISRILREGYVAADQMRDRHLNPANKILKAWHCDPRFLTAKGRPAELKLYGAGPTFESLANQYGRGIPVRAIIDELKRIGAIEQTPQLGICPKASVPVDHRITPKMIREFSREATQLSSMVPKATSLNAMEPPKGRAVRRRNFRRAG